MTTTTDVSTRFVPSVPAVDPLDDVFPAPKDSSVRLYIFDELVESLGLDPEKESVRVKDVYAKKGREWEPGVTQFAWYKAWRQKIDEIAALQDL